MPKTKRYIDGWDKIEEALIAFVKNQVEDMLVDNAIDHEYRLCLAELGLL